ncbi:YceI family protein [Polaribacter pectinis]|uniref:YceI family protein n=1 Tax=Polaribacter pectinis TaxID=2738844 RepID=A0A7G9LE95_9FLAO|nr:YceI family protein [Polaribacter pectinis]QNM86944.1 YceI family protein [Polaribacter pectinis]
MKIIYTLLFCFLFVSITNSQERFLTKNGAITFFSAAAMEDIKADNNQVLSIIDASSGKMAISILMKSFMFEKALMQEHFNENYVESDKFPKATFKGDIVNFESIKDTDTKVTVKGTMTIHGISKEIIIDATMNRTDKQITAIGEFYLAVADFNIEIPAVVSDNIAKKIKVNFEFNHKPYKK